MRLAFLFLVIPLLHTAQDRYAVVITEIMADPAPSVGMPGNEWIELKNVSPSPINLQNWRLGDAGSQSGALPNYVLQPDSFVIVCPGSAIAAMSAYGPAISVTSFPSLDNTGDLLFLLTANGISMHAVAYSDSWYRNDIKKAGGWTLEMTDPASPCAGMNNWKASTHPAGGTPGKRNSTDASNPDLKGPAIRYASSNDSLTIMVVFDEPVDSISGAAISNYTIENGPVILNAEPLSPLFNEVRLWIASPMVPNTIYTIVVTGVVDCAGNSIAGTSRIRAGIPSLALAGDCIINEILFNPHPNGYDYLEIYNNSNKILDAASLYLANRHSSGSIGSVTLLSPSPRYLFPGEYFVMTEDADNLALQYHVQEPDRVLELISLPSFPDDVGTVIILNAQGDVLDEVNYHDDWHFKLINEPQGISLERIDQGAPAGDPANWHSAASTAGYGTPGYKNSQYLGLPIADDVIRVVPKIFSPDNDGRDDIASIQYHIGTPGYVSNITIFDSRGIPVRSLVRNAITGVTGYWNWDGLDDKGRKLPVGVYVVFTEMFNLEGKVKRYKHAVVLVRPLR